jgi:hypothetical protein
VPPPFILTPERVGTWKDWLLRAALW